MAIKRAISTTVLLFCLIGFTLWVAPKNNFGNEIVKGIIFIHFWVWFAFIIVGRDRGTCPGQWVPEKLRSEALWLEWTVISLYLSSRCEHRLWSFQFALEMEIIWESHSMYNMKPMRFSELGICMTYFSYSTVITTTLKRETSLVKVRPRVAMCSWFQVLPSAMDVLVKPHPVLQHKDQGPTFIMGAEMSWTEVSQLVLQVLKNSTYIWPGFPKPLAGCLNVVGMSLLWYPRVAFQRLMCHCGSNAMRTPSDQLCWN